MMTRGVILSVLLHVIIVIVAIFGLPELFSDPIMDEPVVTVELLPIASVSNVKPKQPTVPKIKPAPKKPEPPKRPEPKTAKAEAKVTPPAPKPEVSIPEETKPAPKPVETPSKNIVSLDKTPKPAPKIKPKPPKRPKVVKKTLKKDVKKAEKKKETDPFDALEENLDKLAKSSPKQTEIKKDDKKEDIFEEIEDGLAAKTNKPYNPSIPLSLSEQDALRQQFYDCWVPPIGAKDLENMSASVHFTLHQDGTVSNVELIKTSRYYSDSFYQVFAESALQAVFKCSPLQHLPPIEKYDSWKDTEIMFTPNNMY